jgi:hypothetical protein
VKLMKDFVCKQNTLKDESTFKGNQSIEPNLLVISFVKKFKEQLQIHVNFFHFLGTWFLQNEGDYGEI